MVKGQGRIDWLSRLVQSFCLAEQGAFIARSAGHGGRKLDKSLVEMAQSQQNPAEACVRQGT